MEAVRVDTLPEDARLALAVLALHRGGRASRTAWREDAIRCGLRDALGRQYTGPQFGALVGGLVAAGAACPEERDYRCADRWLAPILEAFHGEGQLVPALRVLGDRARSAGGHGSLGMPGDLRVAVTLGSSELVASALAGAHRSESERASDVRLALGTEPSAAWLGALPAPALRSYLAAAFDHAVEHLQPVSESLLAAAATCSEPAVQARWSSYHTLRGEADAARAALAAALAVPRPARLIREAATVAALGRGDLASACVQYTLPATGASDTGPPWLSALDLLVELTVAGAPLERLAERVGELQRRNGYDVATSMLVALVSARGGRPPPSPTLPRSRSWLDILLIALRSRWIEQRKSLPTLEGLAQIARAGGYHWLARELDAVVLAEPPPGSLATLWGDRAPWELTLAALAALGPSELPAPLGAGPGALHWQVEVRRGQLGVSARWVSPAARRGKPVSVGQLAAADGLVVQPEDEPMAAALIAAKQRRDSLPLAALALLAGHPRVHDASWEPLAIGVAKPTLAVRGEGSDTVLELDPADLMTAPIAIVRAPGMLTVVSHTADSERVARVLGGAALRVPQAGREPLLRTVGGLTERLDVRTRDVSLREEAADATLRAQLRRSTLGLTAALRIVPAAGATPRPPGLGPAVIVHDAPDGLCALRRDLSAERSALALLLAGCPTAAELLDDEAVIFASEPLAMLEVLVELGAFAPAPATPRLVLEWPEGEPLRVVEARAKQLRFTVQGDADWLELRGELRLDEGRVIQLQALLDALAAARGRFVPLGAERYLALTHDLVRQLTALARVRQLGTERGLRGALRPVLESVLDGLEVEWSTSLQQRREAMRAGAGVDPPVPPTLQAELRDYQRDGFAFLWRQAAVGAVLADDMGLGKTVQAIALLLARAPHGPALVVAPTGVLRNWEVELARFAPSLRVHRFAEGERAALVEAAQPGDVVLASYGLLPTAPMLSARRWATLVLDEAHALKNAATQRWRAASKLVADARVALTGTPVENHVGELHALFDVVAPGLLGGRAAFQRVFVTPIATGDPTAAEILRQIVRPLVLRRTKAQVLTELPPKTDILHVVSASAEHRAFYEAVRRDALEKLYGACTPEEAASADPVTVLAEITRLRRAAIDPRLVGGPAAPAGSKVERLAELLDDLRAEGHRALVFSQFLGVLDLARAELEPLGFACLRLDGTQSASTRAGVVEAFQQGEGDVLLASLKAGGVGINLTAADYVIHLDPWWNPAVEDQATDRAHRIGQQRPVTVLRLVTEDTLEEKVLSLHADKRRMFLETVGAADGTGVLDVERLLELLR